MFLCIALVTSCASNYTWGWYAVSPFLEKGRINLVFLLRGLLPTISLSLWAFVLSTTIGLIIALIGKIKNKYINAFSRIWIAFFRSVPVLVMLLWMYYGLPIMTNITISIFASAMITMALCESAFLAEIIRAGIESVSKSQIESAYVMGANFRQVYGQIVLPQALAKMLPAIINQLVYMIKISSLASIIGFPDLTRNANELTVVEYRPLEIYSVLILEYLILVLIATLIEKWVSKRLGPVHEE